MGSVSASEGPRVCPRVVVVVPVVSVVVVLSLSVTVTVVEFPFHLNIYNEGRDAI